MLKNYKDPYQLFKHSPKNADNTNMDPRKAETEITQKYPWSGKFMTRSQIDDYLSGNEIQCLLCGKWFKALHTHLERTHDITPDDYRERYGLPWKQGLCGTETRKKLSNKIHERRKQGFRPPIEKTGEKACKAERGPDQPLLTKPKIDSLTSIIEKLRKYADKDFKNILVKMINEKKSLNDACKEAGMPHPGAVSKYAKKNAEFRKELEMTYEQLPNSVQTGADRLPEKKLKEDLLSLKTTSAKTSDDA